MLSVDKKPLHINSDGASSFGPGWIRDVVVKLKELLHEIQNKLGSIEG